MKKNIDLLEDSSSQAGWMFADLFLALTVIFLATVSFIPSGNNLSRSVSDRNELSTTSERQNKVNALLSNGFIGDYPENAVKKFEADVVRYFKSKELPLDTSALYLEVIGSTGIEDGISDAGNISALRFVIEAKKLLPKILSTTSTSVNLSSEVKSGMVRLKITFN